MIVIKNPLLAVVQTYRKSPVKSNVSFPNTLINPSQFQNLDKSCFNYKSTTAALCGGCWRNALRFSVLADLATGDDEDVCYFIGYFTA